MHTYFQSAIIPFLRHDLKKPVYKSHRYVDWFLRLVLWLVFAAICLQFVYLPQKALNRPNLDLSVKSITAANQDLPFYFEFPPPRGLLTFNQLPYQEMGVYILNAVVYCVGRTVVGDTFQLPLDTGVTIVLCLVLLTSLLFLSPVVPLLVSIGGNLALLIAVFTGAISLWYPASLWGATYGAILTLMMVAVSFTVGRKARPYIFAHIFLLGTLAGITKYFREESTILAYGTVFLMAFTLFVLRFVAFLRSRRNKHSADTSDAISWHPLLYGLLFAAVIYLSQFGIRGLYALAWGVPYSETNDSLHGSGHAMLLSLGYIDNPYNIAWADNVGPQQAQLRLGTPNDLNVVDSVTQVVRQLYEQPDYQPRAGQVSWMMMRENPMLVLDNILAKGNDVFSWLFNPNALYPFEANSTPTYIVFSPIVLILAVTAFLLTFYIAFRFDSAPAWCIGLELP